MANWVTLQNGVHIDLDDPTNPVTGTGSYADLGKGGGGSKVSSFAKGQEVTVGKGTPTEYKAKVVGPAKSITTPTGTYERVTVEYKTPFGTKTEEVRVDKLTSGRTSSEAKATTSTPKVTEGYKKSVDASVKTWSNTIQSADNTITLEGYKKTIDKQVAGLKDLITKEPEDPADKDPTGQTKANDTYEYKQYVKLSKEVKDALVSVSYTEYKEAYHKELEAKDKMIAVQGNSKSTTAQIKAAISESRKASDERRAAHEKYMKYKG